MLACRALWQRGAAGIESVTALGEESMSTKIKKRLSMLVAFSLLMLTVGIFISDPSYAAAKKVHLKKMTISIVQGKTYQQQLIDRKGKTIKATKVKWKSGKTSVAKISKKGKITAVKTGTAPMTAKYGGKTWSPDKHITRH